MALPYNGKQVTQHKIMRGETLSGIARKYGFSSEIPLWNYNKELTDPNLVKAGDILLVPRNRAGYDNLILKLTALKGEMHGMSDRIRYELEGDKYELEAFKVGLDFVGDVATLLGTVGLKAARAAGFAKQAEEATSTSAKAAAKYLADNESKKLAGELKENFLGKTIELINKEDHDVYKMGQQGKKGIEAIRGVSLKGGKSLLDIADILLGEDFAKPSNVAELILAYNILGKKTGETTTESYQLAQQNVQSSTAASIASLDKKIARIQKECAFVHGPRKTLAQKKMGIC